MNKEKRYRLLKDIFSMDLTAKKGDIGVVDILSSNGYPYETKVWFDNGRYFYYEKKIKENPEWFIEEHICKHCGAWTSQPDESCYKAPTEPLKQPLQERIVCSFIEFNSTHNNKWYHTFTTNLPINEFLKAKQAIEKALNQNNNDTEHSEWTKLSDSFRQVAHEYKDGKFDYRTIWKWFQDQQKYYSLTSLPEKQSPLVDNTAEKISTDNSDVPCLSLNDLLEVWDNGLPFHTQYKNSPLYKNFEQKVKEKLKK